MRLDPIVIQPYDARWPESFAEQSARLQACLSTWLSAPIEHIGSTAIPGMAAKPIIDMLALISSIESFNNALAPMSRIGWVRAPEPSDLQRRRWSLCFPSIEHRTHHLHVVEYDSSEWPDWLLFRDYLRAHPRTADRYSDLKRSLAQADNTDRVRYRVGKAPLIEKLLDEARAGKDTDPTL